MLKNEGDGEDNGREKTKTLVVEELERTLNSFK